MPPVYISLGTDILMHFSVVPSAPVEPLEMLWSPFVCVGWTHLWDQSGADNCHSIKLSSSFPPAWHDVFSPSTNQAQLSPYPGGIQCTSNGVFSLWSAASNIPLPGPGIAHGWTTQTLQMGWHSKDRMASSFGSLVGISIDGLFLALFFRGCPSILQRALPVPCLAHSNQLQCLYLLLHLLQWIFLNQLGWWSPLQMVC